MRPLPTMLLLLAAFGQALPAAAAMPLFDAAPRVAGRPVAQARGCHGDVRRHFVPEFGRTASHFHRRDCAPVPGRGHLLHRHVGDDCEIRVINRSTTGG